MKGWKTGTNSMFDEVQELHADGQPRRPMNAFMIFARHRRPTIQKREPGLKTGEISKRLSAEWKSMTDTDKRFYLEQAKRLKDNFHEKYPDYVYRRKAGKPKRKRGGSQGDPSSPETGNAPDGDLSPVLGPKHDQRSDMSNLLQPASGYHNPITSYNTGDALRSGLNSAPYRSYAYPYPSWSSGAPTAYGSGYRPNAYSSSTMSPFSSQSTTSGSSFPSMESHSLGASPASSTYHAGFSTSPSVGYGSGSHQNTSGSGGYNTQPPTTTAAYPTSQYYPTYPYGTGTGSSYPSNYQPSAGPQSSNQPQYRSSYGSSSSFSSNYPPSRQPATDKKEKETKPN
ncbi:hypothetical protein BT69DRAFT_1279891 [Atractiella rhizophila]|nr:hypothetical protein BT69DRAFT_1279891 [Atractiella rhizophila]